MRFVLALIGYAATATVLAAALGIGYLWQTERLTDERVFRVVAMLHGVELDADVDPEEDAIATDIPDEEPSLVEEERMVAIVERNFEAKRVALERSRIEFDHALDQLSTQRDRFDQIAQEINARLQQESNNTIEEGVRKVVRDLVAAKAETAKVMLLKILTGGGSDPVAKQAAMDDVVRLINALPPATWEEIINRFKTEAELQQLHEIQQQNLGGGKKLRDIEAALDQLGNRNLGGSS